jgi:ATP-dependent DNA helicase RecG
MNLGFETERVEHKKSNAETKEAVISMSAMLNKHHGGVIYIGVLNSGEVVGQQIGKDTMRDISTAVYNHLKPTPDFAIDVFDIEDSDSKYFKIVFNGDARLYSAYERYYIRVADEDKEMTPAQLTNFIAQGDSDYSAWENTVTEYGLEVVNESGLLECYKGGLSAGRLSEPYGGKEAALVKLGLFREGKLTNAGRYLFGNNEPVQLKLALFATDAKLTFLDQKHFYGNIFECIDEAMLFVKKHMRWRAEITDHREDIPEIPINALHEIIVNSFAHARYSGALATHEIDIFPSKIYIFNPGKISPIVDPAKYADGGSESILKNPRIARVLYLSNSFESFGTGFQRVFSACKAEGIGFTYENTEQGFSFTFKRELINPAISGATRPKELSDTDIAVLELLRKDGKRSIESLAGGIGKTTRTVDRSVERLKELGYIERIGGKRDGRWVVKA